MSNAIIIGSDIRALTPRRRTRKLIAVDTLTSAERNNLVDYIPLTTQRKMRPARMTVRSLFSFLLLLANRMTCTKAIPCLFRAAQGTRQTRTRAVNWPSIRSWGPPAGLTSRALATIIAEGSEPMAALPVLVQPVDARTRSRMRGCLQRCYRLDS